ncbi:MAG TPA: cation:proton antiporter [Ktedonobacteraceae bacterium]|jgi:CPA1 family monovalent cation:H+ antiporter
MNTNGTLEQVQTVIILLIVTLGVALLSRRLRLPYTLALVIVGLVIGFSPLLPDLRLNPDEVIFLFLPALLFEGAWNVEVERLAADWLVVFLLAVPGLSLSLLIVAVLVHVGMGFSWLLALLLGAMISPTDPVAVLTLLHQMHISDRLRTIVEGESLFNDGAGAAAFELILGLLLASLSQTLAVHESSIWTMALTTLWVMTGGFVLGIGIGIIVTRLLRLIEDHLIEITVTVSVAYGVYLLAVMLHTSGLLAVVGAGLVLGSYGRQTGMSERASNTAHDIWEFIGYIANSLLFLLLGVQIGERNLVHALEGIGWALAGVIIGRAGMIYTLLPLHDAFARWLNRRSAPEQPSHIPRPAPLPAQWRPVLLLSGLRGALSIALVLSLPTTLPQRDLLESIVYGIVLITLLGQGIGLRVLLPHWQQREN